MNTPVKFEIAKLLKEKGFEQKERPSYLLVPFGECTQIGQDADKLGVGDIIGFYLPNKTVNAPTISEVVMWLYEKHGIWITVYTMDKWLPNGNDREQLFDYSLKQMKLGLIDIPKKPEEFNSPTEAYEAGIEYTLKNLI